MRVQGVLLRLHPSVVAGTVRGGVALRDDMGDAGRLGRGQQVIGSLDAQPVGVREIPVGMLHVDLAGVGKAEPRHLVHDHLRPGPGHRLTDRRRVQPVHHDAIRAQICQHAQLGRARRGRRHLVATRGQLRHQPPPQHPRPACHEHPHDHHLPGLRVCLRYPRQDSPAACDIGRWLGQVPARGTRPGAGARRRPVWPPASGVPRAQRLTAVSRPSRDSFSGLRTM